MKKRLDKKGFTLIEMLVVIAIIAVLVAVIIPVVVSATTKANAATDAANLRSVLGQANSLLMTKNADGSLLQSAEFEVGECKTFPGADMYIMYVNPGFIKIFYYDEDNDLYYGLDYFSAIAEKGSTTLIGLSEADAETAHDVTSTPTWYDVSNPNTTGGEGA